MSSLKKHHHRLASPGPSPSPEEKPARQTELKCTLTITGTREDPETFVVNLLWGHRPRDPHGAFERMIFEMMEILGQDAESIDIAAVERGDSHKGTPPTEAKL